MTHIPDDRQRQFFIQDEYHEGKLGQTLYCLESSIDCDIGVLQHHTLKELAEAIANYKSPEPLFGKPPDNDPVFMNYEANLFYPWRLDPSTGLGSTLIFKRGLRPNELEELAKELSNALKKQADED